MESTVTRNNIHIQDSAEVSKDCFGAVLVKLSQEHPDCEVFYKRSLRSCCLEWATHNWLYNLYIMRKHKGRGLELSAENMGKDTLSDSGWNRFDIY